MGFWPVVGVGDRVGEEEGAADQRADPGRRPPARAGRCCGGSARARPARRVEKPCSTRASSSSTVPASCSGGSCGEQVAQRSVGADVARLAGPEAVRVGLVLDARHHRVADRSNGLAMRVRQLGCHASPPTVGALPKLVHPPHQLDQQADPVAAGSVADVFAADVPGGAGDVEVRPGALGGELLEERPGVDRPRLALRRGVDEVRDLPLRQLLVLGMQRQPPGQLSGRLGGAQDLGRQIVVVGDQRRVGRAECDQRRRRSASPRPPAAPPPARRSRRGRRRGSAGPRRRCCSPRRSCRCAG